MRFLLLSLVICQTLLAQSYSISTVAGGGNLFVGGAATAGSIPGGYLATDSRGYLYISSLGVIWVVNPAGTITQTLPTGLTGPIAADNVGNIFLTDTEHRKVFKVTASTGAVTTFAGTGGAPTLTMGDGGPAGQATLAYPAGLAVDRTGNLFIADRGARRVRKVAASTGIISTVAGTPGGDYFCCDGMLATSAKLYDPMGVTVDQGGNLFIVDRNDNRVLKVDTAGIIRAFAGMGYDLPTGGFNSGTNYKLTSPEAIAVDSEGNVYVSDTGRNQIQRVTPTGIIATYAGNGAAGFSGDGTSALAATFNSPGSLAVNASGVLYISDGYRIRRIAPDTSIVTTFAGNGSLAYSGDGDLATRTTLNVPSRVAADRSGNIFISDQANNRIRKVNASTGISTTLAGTGSAGYTGDGGPATSASINAPGGIVVDTNGNVVFADTRNGRIRKVSAANGFISTIAGTVACGFAGDGGSATQASLCAPIGLALDSAGNLYIADSASLRIRRIAATTGVITTVAGNGETVYTYTPSGIPVRVGGYSGDGGLAVKAGLAYPLGLTLDSAGDLYIADTDNNRVRKVAAGTNIITTLAGGGSPTFGGDGGPAAIASLYNPTAVAVDDSGNVLIADRYNNRIRRVSVADGIIRTIAGEGTPGFSGDGSGATAAKLQGPEDVAPMTGNRLLLADTANGRIRMLTAVDAPSVATGGVVPIYSSIEAIQPGSWVSVYGKNLAPSVAIWKGDFPTSLGGVSITVNGKPAYLWFVSPGQINFQAPDDTTRGAVPFVLTTPTGTVRSNVTLVSASPSISLLDNKYIAAAIVTLDGSGTYGGVYDLAGPLGRFPYATRPVRAGELLVMFGVGFGPTDIDLPAGKEVATPGLTRESPTITIGGVPAKILYSGVTAAGLYQFNIVIPQVGSGDQAVKATIGGAATSGTVYLTVE